MSDLEALQRCKAHLDLKAWEGMVPEGRRADAEVSLRQTLLVIMMRKPPGDWTPFANLRGLVRLVLLVDWDPISVLGYPGAMDEYDSYAHKICDMLRSGATRADLIAHLDKLEKHSMGMRGERPTLGEVADKLLDIYAKIFKNELWRTVE